MARKSQAQRIREVQALIAAYGEAGFGPNEWAVGFLNSVLHQMDVRGRYPTKRQRDRIDAMVEEGVPTPKGDMALVAKMDAAVKYWTEKNEREWERNVLTDMRGRVFLGKSMSDKQMKLLNDLIARHAKDIDGGNYMDVTPEQRADLEILVKLYRGYSGQWQSERPAVRKAWERVNNFLAGEVLIEEYHYNKLMKAMGAKLRRMKNPRFNMLDLAKFTERKFVEGAWVKTNSIVTTMTDAYVDDRGRIVNDFLLPGGEVKTLVAELVGKVRKRKSDLV